MDEGSFFQQRLAGQRADMTRRRLRAIEGQTHGLRRMIDEKRPYLDVLVQIAAVQEALSQVNKLIIRTLVEEYSGLAEKAASAEEKAVVYDDMLDLIYKYRR